MKTTSFAAVQSDQQRSDQRFKQQNEVYLRLIQDLKLKHEKEIKKLQDAHVSEIQKIKKAKTTEEADEEIKKMRNVIAAQRERIRSLEEIVLKAKDLFKGMVALLPDKYRPSQFSDLTYHLEQKQMLESLVSNQAGNFPHLLVYGPPGAGKSTRIRCILQKLYGSGAAQLRLSEMQFTTPSKKKLQIMCAASNYHIELTPSDVGMHDRVVVQDVIKDMARTNQLNSKCQRNFKVVVLKEAESLSRDAQDALRRTMEKYMKTCRIILCCTNLSKISGPLQSRCMGIRVAAPTEDDIKNVMDFVAKKEKMYIPETLVNSIMELSQRNLRRALLLLQTAKTENYPFTENQKVKEPQWMAYMNETVALFLDRNIPANDHVPQLRARFNELIQHLIPVPIIFEEIVRRLLLITEEKHHKAIVDSAGDCEEMCIKGTKPIIHLERFAIEVLLLLE